MLPRWYLTTHALLLVLAALICVALVTLGWRHRHDRGGTAFTVLMLAGALWAGSSSLQTASVSLHAKLLWRVVGFVGHNLVPVSLLVFTLAYAGEADSLSRRRVGLLAAGPLVVALVAAPTNVLGLHHLVWTDVGVVDVDGASLFVRAFGPLYWVATAYNYALVLVAIALLVRMAVESRGVARQQGVALVLGVVPPFVANLLWVADATTLDYTPVAFTFSGVIFAVALVRYRMFDLPPVARDTVLARMRDGYLLLDETGRVVDLNATARQLASLDGRVVGHPVEEAFPEYAAVFLRDDGADDARPEVSVDTDDGPRHFEVSASSLSLPRASRRLVLLHDVTERRTVEHRYRTFIESATDVVTVLDEDGTFTYVSPASEGVFGYDPDTLLGRDAFELIHPDDREAVVEAFEKTLTDSSHDPGVEYRFRRADGAWVWLESRGHNLLSDPAVGGIVVNSRDVTERKQRERTLHEQNERLDQFASIVSHDLRNPINVVQGHVDLARNSADDADVEDHLAAIDEATARMESLIDGVLTLARQGRVVGEADDVELETVARTAWGHVATAEATLAFDGELGVVDADPDRLCELFENLFRNAIDHVGDDVAVRVGPLPGGFYVTDDGPGIPESEREAVFQYGYTTADDGTGLGLAIVRSIASAHGWQASVTAADDGATRFEFTDVDRRVPSASEPASKSEERAATPAADPASEGDPDVDSESVE